ncbi:MAG: glycosyltransferase family 39 protein [Chloroflexi bacterium]|nr:glycosyltransferase family 39 protein [Chloroflexota bacterium]MBI3339062.1 glycosyltransferase family 39 protein [Chloroflexota bacterium]
MGANMRQALNRLKSSVRPGFIWRLLIVIGIILRLRQYFVNRSLWADEASLALNLVGRTFSGLTQPLDYGQGAPIVFLFIEKFFIVLLGNKDYIMRLFPLFSGILAIYLIYRISREYIGTAGILAVLMFAVSWQLVYYSSELKQYSSDVMIALLLVYLSNRCIGTDVKARDFILLGVVGSIGIWTSHTAAFILAGIGLVIAFEKLARREYRFLLWALGLGLLWLAVFGLEYFVSLRYLIADPYLQGYWQKAFMPIPHRSNLGWFVTTYFSFLTISFNRTDLILAYIFPVLILIGGISLFFKSRNRALIIILPFLMASLASLLQKYPLKGRFMLFLVPLTLLLIAEGMGRIYLFLAKFNRSFSLFACGFIVLLAFGAPLILTLQNFIEPYRGEDIKPVMQYVQENRSPNDIVYVFHSSGPAFTYYAPFYGLDAGRIIVGIEIPRKKLALQQFFDDVGLLKGNSKVWFVFSAIVDCGGCTGDMQTFYVEYLNTLGKQLNSFNGSGANAYLYDLNP